MPPREGSFRPMPPRPMPPPPSRRSRPMPPAAELDAAATLLQQAAASALGPDTTGTEAEGTAAAETAKALVDTAVTTAVLANHSHDAPVGKQWADDPTTLNIVTAGARPSLEKQPSPDDVSHQFTAGPAEAPSAEAAAVVGPPHGASLADLDAAAGLIQRVAKPALNSVEARLQGLNEPEVQGLRQTAEADEGGIGTAVTAAVATAAPERPASLDAKLSLTLVQPDLDLAAILLQRAAAAALDPVASSPDDAAAAPRHHASISDELATAMAPLVAEVASLEAQLARSAALAAARDEAAPQWSERAVIWREQTGQIASLEDPYRFE